MCLRGAHRLRSLVSSPKLTSCIPFRNQYIIKSSVPTADEYHSPGAKAYEENGTDFVIQHQCAPGLSAISA